MKQNFYKTRGEITAWLKSVDIENFSLIASRKYGFVVNVDEVVHFKDKIVPFFPIKFNIIKGSFYCSKCSLTSLEGSPKTVKGDFYCDSNALNSLQGAPINVKGNFNCNRNSITSLVGSPKKVGGFFSATHNFITSMEGITPHIKDDLFLTANKLVDFIHIPQSVKKDVYVGSKTNSNYQVPITYTQLVDLHLIDKITKEKNMLNTGVVQSSHKDKNSPHKI